MAILLSLAQATPGAGHTPSMPVWFFAQWILAAASVLAIIYMGMRFMQMFKRQPSIDVEFATKKELRYLEGVFKEGDGKTEKKLDSLSLDFNTAIHKMERSDEARTSGIHKRLDVMAENLGEMKGTVQELPRAKALASLEGEVKGLPCKQPHFKGCPS